MSLRGRIRFKLAQHENLYTFLWYLHLVRNESPVNCQRCGRRCPWCHAESVRRRRETRP